VNARPCCASESSTVPTVNSCRFGAVGLGGGGSFTGRTGFVALVGIEVVV
jgi:hypothetical protein